MTLTQHVDGVLTYAGFVALASLSVYAGSLGSYTAPKKSKSKSGDDSSDGEEEVPRRLATSRRLTTSKAMWYPIVASFVLGGFYLALTHFGADRTNKILGYYYLVIGVGRLWSSLASLTKQVVGRRRYRSAPRFHLRLSKTSKPLVILHLPTLLLLPLSTLISLRFFLAEPKPVLLTNMLSLSIVHKNMKIMKLDSLQTGCLLLSGSFFYDVWWVFGTTVMTKVYTTLNTPTKLLWPRSILTFLSNPTGPNPTAFLGLGDVALPGTLVALAYRLDQHLAHEGKPRGTYFRSTMIGYMIGLSMTFGAVHVFRASQPALLYLSPSYCLSFVWTAMRRGELSYVWAWKEGEEDGKEGGKGKQE